MKLTTRPEIKKKTPIGTITAAAAIAIADHKDHIYIYIYDYTIYIYPEREDELYRAKRESCVGERFTKKKECSIKLSIII